MAGKHKGSGSALKRCSESTGVPPRGLPCVLPLIIIPVEQDALQRHLSLFTRIMCRLKGRNQLSVCALVINQCLIPQGPICVQDMCGRDVHYRESPSVG